jgi:tRNA pseudouridine32 synthase / 23S rRNA pseudouridine746 synthase
MTSYWYEGRDRSGQLLRLPRSPEVELLARSLMEELRGNFFNREGKMYGILLTESVAGKRVVLRAFSGLLGGRSDWPDWVPPMPGREVIAIPEAEILAELERLKQALITLVDQREASTYRSKADRFAAELSILTQRHRQQKADRDRQRAGESTDRELSQALEQQSRQDSRERRQFKADRDAILQPLQAELATIEAEIQALKQQRKELSRQFQADLQAHYQLRNFAGEHRSIAELLPRSPTGTGDCCAPKLLIEAARLGLRPLAMAEFWWGPNQGDKQAGQFYGACTDRCQPIMGFLLSGLVPDNLVRLYEDDWFIAIDKPAGLLSVPGRGCDRQDSVFSQLGPGFIPLHRLDQDTSGVLLFARDRDSYRQIAAQFAQGQVTKIYEAILTGSLLQSQGQIDLPLWSDPDDRPYQRVDQRGKSSVTDYQVLAHWTDRTRVQFRPRTGRTHQLRVHAQVGLGAPILGDRLYGAGDTIAVSRLYLHATILQLVHPRSGELIEIRSTVPF